MQETTAPNLPSPDGGCQNIGGQTVNIVLPAGDSGTSTLTAVGEGSKSSKMYNLNVNVSAAQTQSQVTPASALQSASLLAVTSACSTPRTPEILNSLIAMTNPLDEYNAYNGEKSAAKHIKNGSGNDSTSNSSGSPLGSPANGSPPSIQQTCSQLIKTSLKLSIESKRKMSGSDSASETICVKKLKKEESIPSDDDYDSTHTISNRCEGLTPEDEERRRRRRERNKIAATKCRLKKREKTVNLVTESEVLETQNIDLKTQIQELEVQRRQLVEMLSHHSASCVKNNNNASSSSTANSPTTPYNPIQPFESPHGYQPATAYESSSPYLRPESANILASSYSCVTVNGNMNETIPANLDLEVSPQYITSHIVDQNYPRPDSVISVQQMSEVQCYQNDAYMQKHNGLLIIENPDSEYIDHMTFDAPDLSNYQLNHVVTSQAYHNYNGGNANGQPKSDHLDNGCMA